MRRMLWNALGLTAVGLGTIGIFVPLMPTTVFLLVAAYAFSRGSPRLKNWLETHPRLGPPILSWQRHGAITPAHKRAAVIAMSATLVISLLIDLPKAALAIEALCLAGAASFVLTRPNGPPDGAPAASPEPHDE